jgi:L-amino acid N-acyltransferase YncA
MTVTVRPLEPEDTGALLQFFERTPGEERHYLKENLISPKLITQWTSNIDFNRVIPIVALNAGEIVADATLHRTRIEARSHVGELRIVVAPGFREAGLGGRLMRELLDIGTDIGLRAVTIELVAGWEEPAIAAAESVGFNRVARLTGRASDLWGNYQDLIVLDLKLDEHRYWWY